MIRIEARRLAGDGFARAPQCIRTNAAAPCWGRPTEDGRKQVAVALRLENAYEGPRRARYELRAGGPAGWQTGPRASRGMDLIGIYHSHPDCDAYFSETDLKNSCPWYSFVVLSIPAIEGEFRPRQQLAVAQRLEQTAAEQEELS